MADKDMAELLKNLILAVASQNEAINDLAAGVRNLETRIGTPSLIDIARAVKAALVGEVCTGARTAEVTNGGHVWLCYKADFVCESADPGVASDPLACPLVRRVLDALGMGGKERT